MQPSTQQASTRDEQGNYMLPGTNEYGQPIGAALPDWVAPVLPNAQVLTGSYCTLERLDADRHAPELFTAYAKAPDGRDWTYMPVGPFTDLTSYKRWAIDAARSVDPRHYAVIDHRTSRAVGTIALLRQNPGYGSIEVGFVAFSPELQRTVAATEAQFLLMQSIFELGYRRYEWKCDSLNEPSRKVALRLGFRYEGTFRQAAVYKGRNRDTAWYALVDQDWPQVRQAMQQWLNPNNFDSAGQQRTALWIA